MIRNNYMLEQLPVWQHLDFTQQSLIKQSFSLLSWIKTKKFSCFDYSFIVMPAAKAYEGFLKKVFFDLGLINIKDYSEEYFRIGKALNPALQQHKFLRHECLYGPIQKKCGAHTADLLWQAWKNCRNRLFHYFNQEKQAFTLEEAERRLNQLIEAMNSVCATCY